MKPINGGTYIMVHAIQLKKKKKKKNIYNDDEPYGTSPINGGKDAVTLGKDMVQDHPGGNN